MAIRRCPGCGRNLADEYCNCGPVNADGSLHCADKNYSVMLFAQDHMGNDLLPSMAARETAQHASKAETLGDIGKILESMKGAGMTRQSVMYVMNRVYWEREE